MKSIKDFIVHIPKEYNDSFKTESGLEIFADKRWSHRRLANTVAKVVEVPFDYEGEIIQKGFNLLIDISVLIRQNHVKTGIHESHNLVDREKKLFKIPRNLVILYSQGDGAEWKGFEDNLIVRRSEERVDVKSNLYVPDAAKKKIKGKGELIIGNEGLAEMEIENGENIYFDEHGAIDIYIRDTPYVSLKNRYILGKELKVAV